MPDFVFTPVAQNTIIRPLAQAVCMVRGGETVEYTDTADHQKKTIDSADLYFLNLETKINGRKVDIDGTTVSFQARYKPARIRVNVNDVVVIVSRKTTVQSAMDQYKRKMQANLSCTRD